MKKRCAKKKVGVKEQDCRRKEEGPFDDRLRGPAGGVGGVERPRGQALKGSLCPIEESGTLSDFISQPWESASSFKQVALTLSSALLTRISQAPGLKPAHSRDSGSISGMNVNYKPGPG